MICLIQARVSSSRLPYKVLKKIDDKELLLYLVQNLKKSKIIKEIIILTSNNKEDDAICKLCKLNRIQFFRGPLNNTFLRFQKFLSTRIKIKKFIRISGDSPLLDYRLMDEMIFYSRKKKFDIFTNIFPRSFPKGQSIEIINYKSFMSIDSKNLKKNEKEHVTRYFYNNYSKYKILNFKSDVNYSNFNLSVDTQKDLNKIKKILKHLHDKKKKYKKFHKSV